MKATGGTTVSKGDWIEIVVEAGDGARVYEVAARKAGRRVETSTARGVVEVIEVTRTGQVVRTARFMASRVIALVEHPSRDSDGTQPRGTPQDAVLRPR
jgi:hypothetical protein